MSALCYTTAVYTTGGCYGARTWATSAGRSSEHEYILLEEYAAETKKSVSIVIREAIRKTVLVDLEQRRKEQALARLAAGDDPVKDWPEMEKDIESMWEQPNVTY